MDKCDDEARAWPSIVTALYVRYGSYSRLLDALGHHACDIDHSTLSKLRSGRCKRPTWPTGAALLNLLAQVKA